MYPQPDTVRNLGLGIMATGLNESEANRARVHVEEIPFCERAQHGRSGSLAHETYAEYNLKKCDHVYLENAPAS